MDLVAALKAFGVLLASVAGWLVLAAAALDLLFRATAARGERLPAPAEVKARHPAAAVPAMRAADRVSRR
ncbi:MAG TPA: hypothetical protein VFP65_02105 [Anaeromyxobacteraceae bacterium]|nr:hypothetical protein [Anaeromyxobacteraceae bacterium]